MKTYTIDIQTIGNICGIRETRDGFGFSVHDDNGCFEWNTNVIVDNKNRVHIGSKLANLCGFETRWERPSAKVGRSHFYNAEMVVKRIRELAASREKWGSRNENETDVMARRVSFADWLAENFGVGGNAPDPIETKMRVVAG